MQVRDHGRRKKKARDKRKEEKERKRGIGGKEKKKRVEGPLRESRKREEDGCKAQGGRRKRARAGIRVLEARWAWARLWATLSQFSNLFFFCKIISQIIWQIILENGDDCLDKIFSDNFSKIK